MANTIMYDVNGILDVASLIEKGNREFEDEYQNVLNQIKYLRESFTGTVSDTFGQLVVENDAYFRNLIELLDECMQVLKNNANSKTDNAEALQKQIQTNNYFDGGR
jgi:WXG100 family type VII secretion target